MNKTRQLCKLRQPICNELFAVVEYCEKLLGNGYWKKGDLGLTKKPNIFYFLISQFVYYSQLCLF